MPDTETSNQQKSAPASGVDFVGQIIKKISEVENILVTLSRNPSVDEMTAALGLTMYLDKLGKHATAIYSGRTPNMIQFLKPEETFEDNTNSLQDFIVALNKAKADHLRYNIDGDYVKIYITPYKTNIETSDLEFSHGDYNIDLVIALNVPTANDLDAALTEHGRIMHDASAVDITIGEPGKFGEIEWSDPSASSVSEMTAELVLSLQKQMTMDKDSATAFLTGIIASTDRFSNEKTSPKTMSIASELMQLGADQQLVSSHLEEGDSLVGGLNSPDDNVDDDPTKLVIDHSGKQEPEDAQMEENQQNVEPANSESDGKPHLVPSPEMEAQAQTPPEPEFHTPPTEEVLPQPAPVAEPVLPPNSNMTPQSTPEPQPVPDAAMVPQSAPEPQSIPDSTMIPQPAPELIPAQPTQELATESVATPIPESTPAASAPAPVPTQPPSPAPEVEATTPPSAPAPEPTLSGAVDMPAIGESATIDEARTEITPPAGAMNPTSMLAKDQSPVDESATGTKDYGKMIDDALAETTLRGDAPIEPTEPLVTNMAASAAPPVMNQPEANSVPSIDYNQVAPASEQSTLQPVPMPEMATIPPPPPPPVTTVPEVQQAEPVPVPASVPESQPQKQPVSDPNPVVLPETTPESASQPAPVSTSEPVATVTPEMLPEQPLTPESFTVPEANSVSESAPASQSTPAPTLQSAPQPAPTQSVQDQQGTVNIPTPAPGMFQIPGV